MKRSKKHNLYSGVVYSTDPQFEYIQEGVGEQPTLPPAQQRLRIGLDTKQRAGKTATIVQGFVGSLAALEELGKKLKQHCGVGGAVKGGLILIQGDCRAKIIAYLSAQGFNCK